MRVKLTDKARGLRYEAEVRGERVVFGRRELLVQVSGMEAWVAAEGAEVVESPGGEEAL